MVTNTRVKYESPSSYAFKYDQGLSFLFRNNVKLDSQGNNFISHVVLQYQNVCVRK